MKATLDPNPQLAGAEPEPAKTTPKESDPFGLHPAALYGPAGQSVRMLAPHTEAPPVAILLQLLAAFGNLKRGGLIRLFRTFGPYISANRPIAGSATCATGCKTPSSQPQLSLLVAVSTKGSTSGAVHQVR